MLAELGLGEILAVVGGLVGLAGFGLGLWQFAEAQKWRKAELASQLLARLRTEAELDTCLRALDWSTRFLPVPESYRYEFPDTKFEHNWDELAIAMKHETEVGSGRFTPGQALYRDLFDRFFTYLESIEHAISIGLIEKEHVESLRYWLETVAKPRFAPEPVFDVFLQRYDYDGVILLMKRFGITLKTATPSA